MNDRLPGPDDRSLAHRATFPLLQLAADNGFTNHLIYICAIIVCHLRTKTRHCQLAHQDIHVSVDANDIPGNRTAKTAISNDKGLQPVCNGIHLHRPDCELSHHILYDGLSSVSNNSRGCRIQTRLVVPPLMPDMDVEADCTSQTYRL